MYSHLKNHVIRTCLAMEAHRNHGFESETEVRSIVDNGLVIIDDTTILLSRNVTRARNHSRYQNYDQGSWAKEVAQTKRSPKERGLGEVEEAHYPVKRCVKLKIPNSELPTTRQSWGRHF